MNSILDRYLDRVLVYANKSAPKAEAIRKELMDHLLQKVDDLTQSGLSREEATLEALRQHGSPRIIGYKLRGAFPWIDIRAHGAARGVIAIGPTAVGIFAFGRIAVGVVACGTVAVGLFSAGFFAVGLLLAWAFIGAGGIAAAFITIGGVATGYWAIGLLSNGDTAIGAWVPPTGHGPGVLSHYTAENVPPFLKTLEPLLRGCTYFEWNVFAFWPVLILTIFAFSYLRVRECKRVESADDWLIEN